MLSAGTRLGPYEIVAPIGAGGMGEIFRARDTRLDRSVAIKILPAEFAQDAQLKLRLEREAKTISQLNHPNICTLYDVGHENGTDYLVMELCEGESLADKLSRGPLPIAQVLRYAIQITDALDKAHKHGIVHRDLKPANIMVTPTSAKLLDFGLAKNAGGVVVPAFSGATEHKPLTAEGTIVGTFQYMAPEQLEGAEADARTDIFALGTLLYEMATGKRAFDGKTKTSLIAAIINRDPPPISQFQPLTPPAFERVVKTCLAKDPEDRWQTAHDVLLQLRWIEEAGSQAGVAAPVIARRKHRESLSWTVAALLLLATAAFAALWYRAISRKPLRVETSIVAPDTIRVLGSYVSPDGRTVAFTARHEGRSQLWIRPLDKSAPVVLPGTDNASFPFWSPDSRTLAFFADGKLKRIDVVGGPAQTITDAASGRGGTWNSDGVIVFAPTDREALRRVSAAGGKSVPVTRLEAREYTHRFPSFLPDGKHFFFLNQTLSSGTDRGHIFVGDLEGMTPKPLVAANSTAMYSPPGYLLFCRERSLIAQPFDARRLTLSGDAVSVADSVSTNQLNGYANFSVSNNGVVALRRGPSISESRLFWFDRSGKQLAVVGQPGEFVRPRLSHDQRRVAVEVGDMGGRSPDIWVRDLARDTASRFTFNDTFDTGPVWSPDDRDIAYAYESPDDGSRSLVHKISTGAGPQEILYPSREAASLLPTDWSRDGRFILFHQVISRTGTNLDIWIYSLSDKKAFPFLATNFREWQAQFSPDGKWVAYTSDESGSPEIFIQSFPVTGAKWQISTAGGAVPRWRSDGKELFYMGADSRLFSVPIHRSADTLEPGTPVPLFPTRPRPGGLSYDVSSDGKRFLINTVEQDETQEPITLVQNWWAALPK